MLMPHLQAAFYPAEKRGEVSFFIFAQGPKSIAYDRRNIDIPYF
jgi:hypothetical protein